MTNVSTLQSSVFIRGERCENRIHVYTLERTDHDIIYYQDANKLLVTDHRHRDSMGVGTINVRSLQTTSLMGTWIGNNEFSYAIS